MTTTRNIAIRRILLPRDTNHRAEIFGGAILAEIDLAGAVEARRHTEHDVATVAIKEVQFRKPVAVGDVVTFYTRITKIGNTSIHVAVEVEASRDGEGAPHSVTAAEVVYVAVERQEDGSIKAVPVRPPLEYAQKLRLPPLSGMAREAMSRPVNYANLSSDEQWAIDKRLGILDWDPDEEEATAFRLHWAKKVKDAGRDHP